jgi:hypothetical protein
MPRKALLTPFGRNLARYLFALCVLAAALMLIAWLGAGLSGLSIALGFAPMFFAELFPSAILSSLVLVALPASFGGGGLLARRVAGALASIAGLALVTPTLVATQTAAPEGGESLILNFLIAATPVAIVGAVFGGFAESADASGAGKRDRRVLETPEIPPRAGS